MKYMWLTEGETERQTGLYPITEPISVLSSIFSVGQRAEPIITYTVKPSHGEERCREREREQPSCHPQKVKWD